MTGRVAPDRFLDAAQDRLPSRASCGPRTPRTVWCQDPQGHEIGSTDWMWLSDRPADVRAASS